MLINNLDSVVKNKIEQRYKEVLSEKVPCRVCHLREASLFCMVTGRPLCTICFETEVEVDRIPKNRTCRAKRE